jgi:hypothetical protein
MTRTGRPKFSLTLVEARNGSTVPAIQRLKHVLKALGRSYGFTVKDIREITPENTQSEVAALKDGSRLEPTQ